MTEQRHDTAAPFSKAEVALIRQAVLTPGATVECPRCGTALSLEQPATSEASGPGMWWVHCATCQRSLIVHAPTERSASDEETGEGVLNGDERP